MSINKLSSFLVVVFFFSVAAAQELEQYGLSTYSIESETLEEERSGIIYQPKNTDRKLITFYVLDGEWNFETLKSTVDMYRRWNRIPDVRLVGINHKNRTNDLTPSADLQRFPGSGNAASFYKYIKNELIPYVDNNYGVAAQNVLIGHSFGGLFALYVLGTEPSTFDGYIAISPSTWWHERFLYSLSFAQKLNSLDEFPFIYISTAEFDSGATRSSNKEFKNYLEALDLNKSIELEYDLFEGENHFTNLVISIQQALNKIFPGPELKEKIERIYNQGGVNTLKNWYNEEKNSLKERLIFPEEVLLDVSVVQIRKKNYGKARELLNWIIEQNPKSGNGYYYMGFNESQAGQTKNAIDAYQNALKMNLPERTKTLIKGRIEKFSEQSVQEGRKFLPGIVSSKSVEFSATFSPTGREVYFARSDHKWGKAGMKSSIYHASIKNGKWTTPKIVSFSGVYNDAGVHISRDGNTLYFISDRPASGVPVSADIWQVHKNADGQWGVPKRLPSPINSTSIEYSPRTDNMGNLYFASDRPGGFGQGDLYYAKFTNGTFQPPKNIGNTVNSITGEWNLEINSSGDILIFEASQRKENISPYGDLYISFKEDNQWTVPQNIREINTSGSDLYPYLTQDEKHLYYTSSDSLKSQNTDIYIREFSQLLIKYKGQSKLKSQTHKNKKG